ncbi:MAG: DUF2726 domain-containing protein [Gammaproteobacteria bacterium]|nr:DUF2726 domain-containing protein [Gammaproteobacteria bacterium]
MVVAILLVLAVALALLVFWIKRRRAAQGPYLLIESLLTPAERAFAQAMEQAMGGRYRLLAKVRLAELFAVDLPVSSKGWRQAVDDLAGRQADFVVCDSHNFSPLALVELRDPAQGRRGRIEHDDWLVGVCRKVGVPVLVVEARTSYSVAELKRHLAVALATEEDVALEAPLSAEASEPQISTPRSREPQLRQPAGGRAEPHLRQPSGGRTEPRLKAEPAVTSEPRQRTEPQLRQPVADDSRREPERFSAQPPVAGPAVGGFPAGRDPGPTQEGRGRPAVADRIEPELPLGRPVSAQSAVPAKPIAAAAEGLAPHCPRCDAHMVRVRPKDPQAAPFWSCSSYPECRTTLSDAQSHTSPPPLVPSQAPSSLSLDRDDDIDGQPSMRAER